MPWAVACSRRLPASSCECRKNDLPSRCGGEEFAVAVPDKDASDVAALADRCRRQIAATGIRVEDEMVTATASVGWPTPTAPTRLMRC